MAHLQFTGITRLDLLLVILRYLKQWALGVKHRQTKPASHFQLATVKFHGGAAASRFYLKAFLLNQDFFSKGS